MKAALARTRRALAHALEAGAGGPRALAPVYAWLSTRGEILAPPTGTLVVPVRGATLGGSWKTPVAIAVTRALHARGVRAGLGMHAYGGSLQDARAVYPEDDVRAVGDEALVAARSLDPAIPVVAGNRQNAVAALLARDARILVLDGHARRPASSHAAILALDADAPYGSRELVPRGDLRAEPRALLRDARWVLAVHDALRDSSVSIAGARSCAFDLVVPPALARARVAVVTAVARPARFLAALSRRGVRVVGHVALADHGGPWAHASAARGLAELSAFDAIVTTEKCATWLPASIDGRPVVALALSLDIPATLVNDVIAAAADVRRASTSLLQ